MPDSREIVLIALVTAAAWSDLRTKRIPNWITAPGAVLGFLLQVWHGGLHGALASLAGAGLGLAIFLVLYIAAGMGAGDVKLFSAVGAFVGLALAASPGRLRATFHRTGELLLGRSAASAGPGALRLPYGAVIAGGTLLA